MENIPEGAGDKLLHFIVESGLIGFEEGDEEGATLFFTANAGEQVEAWLRDELCRRSGPSPEEDPS